MLNLHKRGCEVLAVFQNKKVPRYVNYISYTKKLFKRGIAYLEDYIGNIGEIANATKCSSSILKTLDIIISNIKII